MVERMFDEWERLIDTIVAEMTYFAKVILLL